MNLGAGMSLPFINTVICGNSLVVLKKLPDECVDMAITSPPYWALRNYSTIPQIWDGDPDCEHDFSLPASGGDLRFRPGYNSQVGNHLNPEIYVRRTLKHKRGETNPGKEAWYKEKGAVDEKPGAFCSKCGAWLGELGLEPDFSLYIKHLCDIFDEIKRVLKKEGSCWVNMGDTYSNTGSNSQPDHTSFGKLTASGYKTKGHRANGLPPKCLCCIPDRFKIEMINRGWICRNEIVWHKPNCMPSSSKDRFTVDYEKLFFFTKSKRYYFDQQFEDFQSNEYDINRMKNGRKEYSGKWANNPGAKPQTGLRKAFVSGCISGRNMRSVWSINTRSFKEAHFAVYPEELIKTPIKAGCPEFVCKKCGKPRVKIYNATGNYIGQGGYGSKTAEHIKVSPTSSLLTKQVKEKAFAGYTDCGCGAGFEPGIVLDPFMGSGTTALVARKLGRNFIGIELNPDYIAIAERRLQRGYG